jgi:hypothetical protein
MVPGTSASAEIGSPHTSRRGSSFAVLNGHRLSVFSDAPRSGISSIVGADAGSPGGQTDSLARIFLFGDVLVLRH